MNPERAFPAISAPSRLLAALVRRPKAMGPTGTLWQSSSVVGGQTKSAHLLSPLWPLRACWCHRLRRSNPFEKNLARKQTRFLSSSKQVNDSPHKLLDLETANPTKSQLRNAYFLKAKACHPDVNQFDPSAKEEFARISKAYQHLLRETLEKEASGEKIKENIGDYFTCPTLGHHKSGNMQCQIENCPFCAMFGGGGGGGNYYEAAFDPSIVKPTTQKSKSSSIKGKKLPPVQPLFRK